ncbi:50S ribosomal protein L37e [Candidatus Bathyarchaeota archaeon]|nr:50S ribosomal protein L37e [Candidatus Bathyarchaeota archaeon]MCK4434594.1 50S ribosomal protein L37e [Candidatus Bathyarchaeota archaeon]MCK4669386.1 50S ribosomal protein L37e [Candidatus Bathyarchaeota archaeon]TET65523.1 MAG: 50S ribosomal protein L37e [Candidatus Bathyarchaeota archaeon]
MGKGTPSFGKHQGKTVHIKCRRCGRRAYNVTKKQCAACGYGKTKTISKHSWRTKNLNRERTS